MSRPRTRPSRRRALRHLALAATLLTQAGCVYMAGGSALGAALGIASAPSESALGTGALREHAAVTIDFSPPRDVAAVAPGQRDSLRVREVTRLVGRVRSVHGDTSWIALTEMRHLRGSPLMFGSRRAPVTMLVSDATMRARLVSKRPETTQRGLVGAALGFVAGFAAAVASCDGDCLK